ncbi:hypothetical protein L1887_22896 [Cichorium endivia]|nr:hypothetical protein L1887_22896 [Cichorium endivia]
MRKDGEERYKSPEESSFNLCIVVHLCTTRCRRCPKIGFLRGHISLHQVWEKLSSLSRNHKLVLVVVSYS